MTPMIASILNLMGPDMMVILLIAYFCSARRNCLSLPVGWAERSKSSALPEMKLRRDWVSPAVAE